MPNLSLTARTALDGAQFDYNGCTIQELPNLRLLSVATNASQISDASSQLNTALGVSWPEVGSSTAKGEVRCLGLQAEQVFVMTNHDDAAHEALAKELGASMAITDQSDSWVAIRVDGPESVAVLERICPIDLHESVFPEGSVARTSMEHLGAVIVHDDQGFLLLSARSSADSFLHAITQSADFVL